MDKVFAIMPFGVQDSNKSKNFKIDFDSIYNKAIKPACKEAGLKIIRADEEITGGIIHSLMFERLVCANIAIVDMSNQNANVCYELGFRHCARECHTIIIFDEDTKLPFDFTFERAIPYKLNKGVLSDENAEALKNKLVERLKDVKLAKGIKDSPAFELIEGFPTTKLDEKELNIYRKKQDLYEDLIDEIELCNDTTEIKNCLKKILEFDLSLRVLGYYIVNKLKEMEEWSGIIDFLNTETKDNIKDSEYFMQQLSIAYNKRELDGDKQKAIKILEKILEKYGESSETYGLLGSIYKTLYEQEEDARLKLIYLNLAIDNYKKGFDSNITDYYPGINLATLLFKKYDITGDTKLLKDMDSVLTIVKYDLKTPAIGDYWHYATLFETSVLLRNFTELEQILNDICLLDVQGKIQDWEKETTLKNLLIIKNVYKKDGKPTDWYESFKNRLSVKEVANVLD